MEINVPDNVFPEKKKTDKEIEEENRIQNGNIYFEIRK